MIHVIVKRPRSNPGDASLSVVIITTETNQRETALQWDIRPDDPDWIFDEFTVRDLISLNLWVSACPDIDPV